MFYRDMPPKKSLAMKPNLSLIMSRQIKSWLPTIMTSIVWSLVPSLKNWEAGDVAVLLVDGQMPNMDGYQMVKELRKRERANHAHKRSVVIGVTANALRGDDQICFDAGMDDYLAKPVALETLQAKLEEWIKPSLQ